MKNISKMDGWQKVDNNDISDFSVAFFLRKL